MPTQTTSLEPSSTTSLAMYSSIATSSNPILTIPFGNTAFQTNLVAFFQEIRDIKGTDTCFFICKQQIPHHKQATYGWICCNYRPQKDEPHCTRLTVGGDQITYDGNKSTPTAITLVTAKLLINSTISTTKAKFYGMDLSIFYLMTPMKEYEYMRLQLKLIPNKIIHKYNLRDLVDEQGWVYVELQMGMYGLPQAGILAKKLLKQCLNAKGYYHCQHTPGLWCHMWQDISFCLMVDNFGIKSTSCNHALHVKTTLEEHYTVPWTGTALTFAALTLTEIILPVPSTSICPTTFPKLSLNSNTRLPTCNSINGTNMLPSNTVPKFRGWMSTHLAHNPLMPSNVFKTLLALFYTTDRLSIPHF
jgi:hypothetical protein